MGANGVWDGQFSVFQDCLAPGMIFGISAPPLSFHSQVPVRSHYDNYKCPPLLISKCPLGGMPLSRVGTAVNWAVRAGSLEMGESKGAAEQDSEDWHRIWE